MKKQLIILLAISITIVLIFTGPRFYEMATSNTLVKPEENINDTLFKVIKADITPGHNLGVMVSFLEPTTKIAIANPSKTIFHNCIVTENTKNENITLRNYPIIDQNFFQLFSLNSTFDETNKVFFECINPHDITSWPKIYSDKTEYSPNDMITIRGILEPLKNTTIEVINPDQTNDTIFRPNQTYYIKQEIKTGDDGSYLFSFTIPENTKQGKWAARVGDPIYYGNTLYFDVKPNNTAINKNQ